MENLDPSQKLVLDNIMNSNLLATEAAATAIKNTVAIEAVGAGTLGAGGVTAGIGAVGAAGATSAAVATAAATMGIGLLVLGGVVAIGGAAYGIDKYIESYNGEKGRAQKNEDYVRDIEENIWILYFKDELRAQRGNDLRKLFTFDRDHEAIDSYIEAVLSSYSLILLNKVIL